MSEQEVVVMEMPEVSVRLARAREGAGLTQKDVADQLFLTTTFIRYIDEGTFDKIPKPAFIKGYIRSYARVVSLDGNEMVAVYEQGLAREDDAVEVQDVTGETVGSANFTGPVLKTAVTALLALLVIILLVWVFTSSEDEIKPQVNYPAAEVRDEIVEPRTPVEDIVPDPLPLSEASISLDDFKETSETKETSENIETSETIASSEQIEAVLQDEASWFDGPDQNNPQTLESDAEAMTSDAGMEEKAINVSREAGDNGQIIRVVAAGEDQMELVFSDDCWVEIQDVDGVSLYGDLNRAGDTLRLNGVAPFEILLGKGPAVRMTFNGANVDLSRFTRRDQTAKVVLGTR